MVGAIRDVQVIAALQNCKNMVKRSCQFIPYLEICIQAVMQIKQPVVDVPIKAG
jgi:hypothetical protein